MTPISNAEKRQRLSRLSEEEWMRWAYVPFVVAEGAWDYADSVVNIAAQMRLPQTKRLSRAVRELKRGYDSRRAALAMDCSGHELDNFQVMEAVSAKSFKFLYSCIDKSTRRHFPDLQDGYRALLQGVHACIAVLDVLSKYVKRQEALVCQKCGFAAVGSILPPEVGALRALIPEFAGDKSMKVAGRGLFVHNVVQALCSCQLERQSNEGGGKEEARP